MLAHFRTHQLKYFSFAVVAALVGLVTYTIFYAKAEAVPTFVENFYANTPVIPGHIVTGSELGPSDVTVDPAGNMFVSDEYDNSIKKFNSSGQLVMQLGSLGTGDGQFSVPQAVSLDSSGNIYIADSGNNRIQKFDPSGAFMMKFGTPGTGNGEFGSGIDGVVVDNAGNIYVADTENNRIQKFNTNGEYVSQFGTSGSSTGQFSSPIYLALDSLGNLYVSDLWNFRVQKFDSDGNYLLQFGAEGTGDGQFSGPLGIAVDSSDNVFVADSFGGARIEKFDSSGNYISQVNNSGGLNAGNHIKGLDVDASGNIYMAGDDLIIINSSGSLVSFLGEYGGFYDIEYSEIYYPESVTTDLSGNVYVVNTDDDNILKLDQSGNLLLKIGASGSGDGQFSYPIAATVDKDGNLYVVDSNNYRIEKFDPSGDFVAEFGSYGSGSGQFGFAEGIATDSVGNVYIADEENNRIVKFDSAGNFLGTLGGPGTGNGQFQTPSDIFIDSENNLYVADADNSRIQKFDSNGTYVFQFGEWGESDGQFDTLKGITVDMSGNIYTVEKFNHRVQKFDRDGNFILKFGTQGSGDGQLYRPSGIALGLGGKIYVSDKNNSRISVWQSELPTAPPVISEISASSFENTVSISWHTDVPATSQVEFGPSVSYGSTTEERALNARTSSYVFNLEGLIPCALYHYRVISSVPGAATTSESNTFTTDSCTGLASSTESIATTASTTTTSTVTLSTITLSIPPDFSTTTVATTTFQAIKLEPVAFFASSSVPEGKTSASADVYHLSALTEATTTEVLSSFTAPLTITLTYDPEHLNGVNPSTLKIYRYDDTAWTPLTACSRDSSAHSVTCETSHFSDFALFGTADAAPQAQTSGGSYFVHDPAYVAPGSTTQPAAPVATPPVPSVTKPVIAPPVKTVTKPGTVPLPVKATSTKAAVPTSAPAVKNTTAVSTSAPKLSAVQPPSIVNTPPATVPATLLQQAAVKKSFFQIILEKVRGFFSK